MKPFWVALLVALCALTSKQVAASRKTLQFEGNDHASDEECELQGIVAATIAAEIACHELKIRCTIGLPSEGGGASQQFRRDQNPFEGLKPECVRGARTACRTTARGVIQEDTNSECLDLLVNGPKESTLGCWNLQEAINEFNWTIKAVCLDDAIMLHGGDAGEPNGR
ncbi:hypothetical protein BSKO_11246 [Bryopsis sp. KO-2023]|nr:hypothetical protein BSKO_11246 [Bryopsis sp. KO-2023]